MMSKLLDQGSVSQSLDLWEGFPKTAIRVKEGGKKEGGSRGKTEEGDMMYEQTVTILCSFGDAENYLQIAGSYFSAADLNSF